MEPETLFVIESDEAREDRTGYAPAATSPTPDGDIELPRRSRYASDRRAPEDPEATP